MCVQDHNVHSGRYAPVRKCSPLVDVSDWLRALEHTVGHCAELRATKRSKEYDEEASKEKWIKARPGEDTMRVAAFYP